MTYNDHCIILRYLAFYIWIDLNVHKKKLIFKIIFFKIRLNSYKSNKVVICFIFLHVLDVTDDYQVNGHVAH